MEELLSVKEWLRAANTETGYTASPTTVTLAAPPTDANLRYRFVRIQAHDGDLLVEIGHENSAPAVPNGGSLRVRNGSEVFQLKAGGLTPSLKIAATTGTVNGAVIWGR